MLVQVEASVDTMARKARQTDRDAVLSALFREQYGALVGLASLLLDERGQAEEVVQEAFARVYAAWSRLDSPSAPLAYLRRTVVNLARGGLRRRMVARRYRPTPIPDEESADAGLLVTEQHAEIVAAVESLPRRQRECVVLRYFADCSIAETAVALGISEGAVKQHVHRAITALAAILTDETEAAS